MSILLDHAPRFSSGAALHRHYRAVKQRMLSLAPPDVKALPSPEMMARGNQMPAVAVDLPKPVTPEAYVGELQTVHDIVPAQYGVPVREIKMLSAESERVAIRRAIRAYLAVPDTTRFNRLRALKQSVATCFKIDIVGLTDTARTTGIVRIRQTAICIARKFELGSLCEVGNAFGGRDHTTVLHASLKMKPLVDEILADLPPIPDREQMARARIHVQGAVRYARVG